MSLTLSSEDNRKVVKFTKMHGIGNDYVYLFDSGTSGADALPDDLSYLARAISDRHCGVGGDGLVVISRCEQPGADFRMRMFNADGSEAQMCGNASRCIGKYLFEKGYTESTEIRLMTLAGVKVLHLNVKDGKVHSVCVDMGEPVFEAAAIPARGCNKSSSAPWLEEVKVSVKGEELQFATLSMGNPHAICFISDAPDDAHVLGSGPLVEKHEAWPEKVNVEFARVLNRHLIEMRVWERGTGETMACGTGACATAVAAISLGLAESPVVIRLSGGDLEISWERPSGHVLMTGGATTVADGFYYFDSESDNIWLHPRQ